MTDAQAVPPPPFARPPMPAPPQATPPSARTALLMVSGALSSVLLAVALAVPSPYAVTSAGPTFDLLSDVEGQQLVTIEGAPTYQPEGDMRITTVQVSRGSTALFSIGHVARSWASRDALVVPEELYWPRDGDGQQQEAQRDWVTSQELATVSALDELGIEAPADVVVVDIEPESFAVGVLQENDQIVRANGADVESLNDLSDALDALTPGDDIRLTVLREGSPVEVHFETLESPDGSAIMGIWIDPDFHLPVAVDVRIDDVGGPSAGMMFSLAILALMTPGDELNGASVAGTGTIDLQGNVGPIGGVNLKMLGARADGADFFIASEANCDGIVGHIPDGLTVVTVETLDEAYTALQRIGAGQTDQLVACAGR